MKTLPDLVVKTLVLEKIKLEYGIDIPPDVISNLTIEQLVNYETKGLRVFFKTFIPGRKIREEVIGRVIVYHSWWEHFKAACFPRLLKRWLPVKFHEEPITIRHYHLCPHTGLDLSGPEDKKLHWEFMEGLEPDDWMEPFIKIAEGNLFGGERK